jgi:hypothetical protein
LDDLAGVGPVGGRCRVGEHAAPMQRPHRVLGGQPQVGQRGRAGGGDVAGLQCQVLGVQRVAELIAGEDDGGDGR